VCVGEDDTTIQIDDDEDVKKVKRKRSLKDQSKEGGPAKLEFTYKKVTKSGLNRNILMHKIY
jgi:hypothetical protein